MIINDALTFLKTAIVNPESGNWVDLGCGSGTFTKALAQFLPSGSNIFAIDKKSQNFNDPNIFFLQWDFEKDLLPIHNINGVLMANILHYISDKLSFLNGMHNYLLPAKQLIIIEYDTAVVNEWIPYPINYPQLHALLDNSGFSKISKTSERKSLYTHSMYIVKAEFISNN